MTGRFCTRLPVGPGQPQVTSSVEIMEPDETRQLINDNERLSIMHVRIYDYWRPSLGRQLAYRLALLAWSDEAGYQALKRQLGVGA